MKAHFKKIKKIKNKKTETAEKADIQLQIRHMLLWFCQFNTFSLHTSISGEFHGWSAIQRKQAITWLELKHSQETARTVGKASIFVKIPKSINQSSAVSWRTGKKPSRSKLKVRALKFSLTIYLSACRENIKQEN